MTVHGDERRQAPVSAIWEIDEKKQVIEGLDAEGRPDPAYAAALGLLNAPFGRRALALVCDVAIWMLLQLPLWLGAVPLLLKLVTGSISSYGFVNHPGFVLAIVMAGITLLLSLVYCVVQLVMHGRKGVTIGKAIAGLRSVNVRTLEKPGVGAVLLRFLIVYVSNIVPVLGPALFLASPTFDPDRRGRGLHDKAASVWLVDVRRGLQPFDEKRMRVARKTVKAEPTQERATLPSLATSLDPAAQPQYRPGNRVSAGVLGIARPYEAHERAVTGTPAAAAPAAEPQPAEPQSVLSQPAEPVAPQPLLQQPPQPVESQPAEPVARFGLRLDTGESIPVTEPVLLGRNPDAAVHPGARPIALTDDSRSLSKTHLLVRPIEGGLEILDCQSTNGSGLIRAGVEHEVAAGAPVATTDGDTIRIGDRTAAVVRL